MSIFNRKKGTQEERSFLPETTVVYTPLLFKSELNPTVAACVNKICNTLGILPLQLYAHTKTGKKLAISNPLFRVLEHPAYEETPTLFYNSLIRCILLKGNGYVYISRNKNGQVVNLSIIDPTKVRVSRDANYRKLFNVNGKVYTEREVLHIPYNGPGYNGTIGVSPIETNKEIIELDNLLLAYIQAYFNNSVGTRVSLELGESYNGKAVDLDKTYAALIPIINKYVTGASNAGKMMLPPPDSKLNKIEQTSNVQAELASLLNMVERQICSAFNVPYEIINTEASKYNSLEMKQNDFLSNCIQPLGQHICESFEKLIPVEDTALFIAYEYKNLLTTDTKTTIEYLRSEVQAGLLTLNEARSKLGMEDIGKVGDYYFIPSNLVPLTEDNVDAYMAKSKAALAETPITESEKNEDHNPAGDDKA